MCLAVYLTSDDPLPIVPALEERPGLYVSDRAGALRAVRQHNSRRHVYYVGTHTGCGCGFLYDGCPPGSSEYRDVQRMYHELAGYLREHAGRAAVELLVYWGGDEHLAPGEHRVMSVSALTEAGFGFEERVALTIQP